MINFDTGVAFDQPLAIMVLISAAVLDFAIGDPWWCPHPVQMMGWIVQRYTKGALRWWNEPWQLRIAGIHLTIALVCSVSLGSWLLFYGLDRWAWPVSLGLEVILLASCFAGRSLHDAAVDVLKPLGQADLTVARSRLRRYVGRDTDTLAEQDILRALLETIAENATDGVMAPLFYALVGLAIPGVGPVPVALFYKAVSTLDSMIGYRTAPYTDLGWFSARLDDVLTWFPCRLMVLTVGLLSGKLKSVWVIGWRDARKDPSPNSGWSECAYAAILGVQLGGQNWYRGVAKLKPLLGNPLQRITEKHIEVAIRLTRNCFLMWLGLAVAFTWLTMPTPLSWG
ncbi:adenosylcobinamide-phosphate synthase CbiB [Acaryochloris sp. CCMEE 5410]|uniref:adenosylcobinamide-phosphate synthase CbiB n=1 Tax=Acaryochloris sp. CCMEE 5410 TaxID=310037 RepID=UPI0002484E03|nr:adenosylcobinamide-phosphate synthase CbiB [Acaryochloris sp. CCMEE 5410]